VPKGWILVIGFCWPLLLLVVLAVRHAKPTNAPFQESRILSYTGGSGSIRDSVDPGFIACAPAGPDDPAFAATPVPWPGDPGFWPLAPTLPLDPNACTGVGTPIPLIVSSAP